MQFSCVWSDGHHARIPIWEQFHGAGSSIRPHGVVTLVSGSGGGSVSAIRSPAKLAVPRPSKSATQALPSRRDGNRTAPAPRSKRPAAIVCVMARRLVVISCRSRCRRSCSSSSSTWMLDLLACGDVGQVDQGAIELEDCGNEDVLYAPPRSDRLLSEVLSGLGSVALDMAAQRAQVRPEVG